MIQANITKLDQWSEAKKRLNKVPFPSIYNPPEETKVGEYHMEGKREHQLKTYIVNLAPILNFEVQAKWNYCEECKMVRNKYLVMKNGARSEVYIRWITKHGKAMDSNLIIK